MQPTTHDLADLIRALRQRDQAADADPAWPAGVPLPAPDVTPIRCGCRVPLMWDAHTSRWIHLDDLTPCIPGYPRPYRR